MLLILFSLNIFCVGKSERKRRRKRIPKERRTTSQAEK
jgi:hypothetical protein